MANKNTLDNLTGQEIKEMINVGNIEIEQLGASALRKLMNYEVDMLCFGEGDLELIDKCSELLDEIDPVPMSSEEFMNIIRRNEKERITIIEDGASYNRVPQKRFVLKRIAIVAAAVVILIASTVSVAAAFGFDVFKYISQIVRAPEGTESNFEEFTFYKNNETKKYSSIEQLLEDEELDIMYPTKLPEGSIIKSIRINIESNEKETVQIVTNDIDTNIQIGLSSNQIITNRTETIEINGIKYYIQKGDLVSASCYLNNNTYYISAKTLDDVIFIIDNMKEK